MADVIGDIFLSLKRGNIEGEGNTLEILQGELRIKEWFDGFTDAEGNFCIKLNKTRVQLMFQIGLHWDNLPLLTFLKDKLQYGYIT
jgi:hypothetical protein